MEKTFTAPLALIKMKGVIVGKIKNINVTEQYQRGDVRGLGTLVSQEKPIISIACSFSCSSYMISVKKLGTIDNPFMRVAQTAEQFVNTLLTQDEGIDIYVLKKGAKTITNGIVTEASESVEFVIASAFLTSQSFQIQEGQIAGSDLQGEYLNPVLTSLN